MNTRTLKELVLEEPALAGLFEKHGIDFCCGGDISLEEACTKRGLESEAFQLEIQQWRSSHNAAFAHYELWDVEFLIDYIVQNHHRYCAETIPILLSRLKTVSEKHGDRHPHYKQVYMLFQSAAQEIEQHTRKEEMIFFPYLKSLASAKDLGRLKPLAPFHTVQGPIVRMEKEHQQVGDIFFKIRALLHNYSVPEEACSTQRSAIRGLEEFERDLHFHIHLENNILFPAALRLENELDLYPRMGASGAGPAPGSSFPRYRAPRTSRYYRHDSDDGCTINGCNPE